MEIVSSGPDRIIVYEGAEDKLKQLNSGVLEKLGIGGASWEEQERERYKMNLVPVENQLSSGQPVEKEQPRLAESQRELLQTKEELEYIEIEDLNRSSRAQHRYIDDENYNQNSLNYNDSYYENESYEKTTKSSPVQASRRAIQQPGEPMDVEPIERKIAKAEDVNPENKNNLDDPW